jgi:hypothetical protein
MSCKVGWDRKFLSENLEKSFMYKEYKFYRENILYERELSMLQATQPHVEKEVRMEEIQEQIAKLTEEFKRKVGELKKEQSELKNTDATEKRKFVRKCPNSDCLGFLSSSLKCDLCKCWACSDCREIKGYTTDQKNNHVCDKNILESVKLLEKDSKPCPSCSALIFKINGCNQMFCTECNTAFDWVTLKIEKGVIHNPHFFEYQRQLNNGRLPRNPLDIQCGRELDGNFVRRLINVFKPEKSVFRGNKSKNHEIIEICRNVIHIRHIDQPRFSIPDRLTNNLFERIQFMRKKIDTETFKKTIQKKEKKHAKNTEINNVLAMYVTSMTDILYRSLNDPKNYDSIKLEMNNLREYTNQCFQNISIIYNCKYYQINSNFIFN